MDFDGLFNDMHTLMPDVPKETALDIVRFWLAGSGLENIDSINDYNRTYLDELSAYYNRWSEGYDPKSFFDLMQVSIVLCFLILKIEKVIQLYFFFFYVLCLQFFCTIAYL